MSNIIPLFPTFNEDIKDDIFEMGSYVFSYERDHGHIELIQKFDDTGLCAEAALTDETGYWNPDEYPLCVSRKISVLNASQLYSSTNPSADKPNAIVCSDAVIGIGLKWSSSESNQCGSIPIGSIFKTSAKQEFEVNYSFPESSIRGEIVFSIILYVQNSGKPKQHEEQFANNSGLVLGEIDTFAIRIDGNGSFFPIYEIDKPGAPLWDVNCSFTDACSDPFSDTVAIYINKGHKNYKYLNRADNRNYNPQLFLEIMANAIGVIIDTIRVDDKDFVTLENGQEGSVAQAVHYFMEKLDWNLKTPQTTSKSIRNFLEDKLKML